MASGDVQDYYHSELLGFLEDLGGSHKKAAQGSIGTKKEAREAISKSNAALPRMIDDFIASRSAQDTRFELTSRTDPEQRWIERRLRRLIQAEISEPSDSNQVELHATLEILKKSRLLESKDPPLKAWEPAAFLCMDEKHKSKVILETFSDPRF